LRGVQHVVVRRGQSSRPRQLAYINHENGFVSHGPFRTLAELTGTGDWIAGVGAGVSVPEPATVLLLGAGMTGLGLVARKRSRKD
jgi:PEP-CTERM motif